jgi:NADH dehydrogenase FAD-containing subunit
LCIWNKPLSYLVFFFFNINQIKVKSGAKIEAITPTGVAFSDGTKLDADVIVYATGYMVPFSPSL